MKILLVGEYSGFHNSLKEGLIALGHEVLLISHGDGFKSYPSDIKIDAFIIKRYWFLRKLKNLIYRLFKLDLASLETELRFYKIRSQLSGFEVIQLINSITFLCTPKTEKRIFKQLLKNKKKIYLHAGGTDAPWIDYMMNTHTGFSSLTPYRENNSLKPHFLSSHKYTLPAYKKHYQFIHKHINGLIPSDIDYEIVYHGTHKALPMIPTPVNLSKLVFKKLNFKNPVITVFCGVNTSNKFAKGIPYFLEALDIIKNKYGQRVNIKITYDLPYDEYMKVYETAHILLDQCLSYDQGYNGREAMARGKVVISGANDDFKKYYNLTEDTMPLVEAKPDVEYIVNQLSLLLDNPKKMEAISIRARNFIEQQHNYIAIAEKYLTAWGSV